MTARGMQRSGALLRRVGPHVLLALIPLLANLLPLITPWSSDPRQFVSGLTIGSLKRILPGQPGWIDPHAGFTMQALGGLAAEEWLQGRVPWWNPYSGIGLPLAAEMQPGAFFLPFVLLLQLGQGLVLLKVVLQAITGLATYTLLRRLGLTRAAALLGGVWYQLSGTFAWFADAPITPIAFLPLLLLGIEQAQDAARASRAGGWAAIAVAIAYSLYAGFPETAYLNGLLALAWAVLRLATGAPGMRLAFLGKVVAGGISGLLLAAPLLLPFVQFVLVADGSARQDFNRLGPPAETFAVYLLPYLFGPIFAFAHLDPALRVGTVWGTIGGYVGIPLTFLALLGLLAPRRERAMRLLLGGWIAVCLARIGMVPGITELVGSVPLMSVTAFFRYAQPSWVLAATILAAFALDDWHRGAVIDRWRFCIALAIMAITLGLVLATASGAIVTLWRASAGYQPFPLISVAWAVAVLAASSCLLRRGPARGLRPLAALLVVDAGLMFCLPLLSGARNHTLDTGAVAFLQRNLGLARFYTLGPLGPNYGAQYRIASVNHNYQPIPEAWVRHVRARLDPALDPPLFVGNQPAIDADGQTRLDALRRRRAAYTALGVRYVLVRPGQNPLAAPEAATRFGDVPPAAALPLPEEGALEGAVPSTLSRTGEVVAFSIVVDTHGGAVDGALVLRLCSPADCVEGRRPFAEATDHQPFRLALARPLAVAPDQSLRLSLRQESGTRQAAIPVWRPPAAAPGMPGSRGWLGDPAAGQLPALSLSYADPAASSASEPVYRSSVVEIFELPDPAPYFEARGAACRLQVAARDALRANCLGPATLVRREFFDEGWTATVNGHTTAVRPADGIFQSVDLPAGESDIAFAYSPPHIRWTLPAFAMGLVGCALGLRRMRRGQRESESSRCEHR